MRTKEELIAAYDNAEDGSLLPVTEEEMEVLNAEISQRLRGCRGLIDESFEAVIKINRDSQMSDPLTFPTRTRNEQCTRDRP